MSQQDRALQIVPHVRRAAAHFAPERRGVALTAGLPSPTVTRLTQAMRVIKHEHAALTVEEQGKRLMIDIGGFTVLPEQIAHVVAIVVTHEHPDHWTPEHLLRIQEVSPGARIFAPQGVANAIAQNPAADGIEVTVVSPGEELYVAPFALRFFGGKHAVIHESMPVVDNVGVLVNETLYHPGDSYAVPEGVDVPLLAAPIGAPWLKIGEAMDFVLAVAPKTAFPIHEMTLSHLGQQMGHGRLAWATEQGSGTFVVLEPGEHLDT